MGNRNNFDNFTVVVCLSVNLVKILFMYAIFKEQIVIKFGKTWI